MGVTDTWREQRRKVITAGSPAEVAKAIACLGLDEWAWRIGSEIVVFDGRMLNM